MCCISDGERTHQRSTCELAVTTRADDDDALDVFDVRLRVRCEEGLLYGGSL